MLTIRQHQLDSLTLVPREAFLETLCTHLQGIADTGFPTKEQDYWSQSAVGRLSDEIGLLLHSGFEYTRDVAAAIEYFELFNIDLNGAGTLHILQSDATTREKLNSLRIASGTASPGLLF